MTITKTTRLMSAHETRIRIKLDDPASLTWGMYSLTLAEGHEKAIVDWGDGTRTEVTASGSQTHDYAQPGEYEVRISDDIASIRCSGASASDPFYAIYSARIVSFTTSAAELARIPGMCFAEASNMTTFGCKGSGVATIESRAFKGCFALRGSVCLQPVTSLLSSTFTNCPAVTEIVFDQANYDIISALPGYDAKFGATNAEVLFDP